MQTLQFIMVLYLIVSFISFAYVFVSNYDFFVKMSKKKTDQINKELDKRLERGEITPMQRDGLVETYKGGFITYVITQFIRAPFDFPGHFFIIMIDAKLDPDEIKDVDEEE